MGQQKEGEEVKRCAKCGNVKMMNAFYKNPKNKDGLHSYCKQCISERGRQYYKQNKNKVLDRMQQYRQENKGEISDRKKRLYYNSQYGKQHITVRNGRQYLISSGRRFIHDFIVEKVLGRRLRKNENVHHIDGNGLNNNHNNLLVCTREYHSALHRRAEAQASQ